MIFYVDGESLLDFLAEAGDGLIVEQDREKSRANLARWVARYCEARGCEAVVVFGGRPPGQAVTPTDRVGKVTVVNVPPGEEAWTEIAGPANRRATQERVTVVTGDRRLVAALRRGRARVLGPDAFVARARRAMRKGEESLAREPDEKFTGLTDDEVAYWLEFFGEKEGE